MMKPEDSQRIWDEVKANYAKLQACVGPHGFEDIDPGKTFGKRYRCRLCGGELDGAKVSWYQLGLEHGG
jgi:hypothetical protein